MKALGPTFDEHEAIDELKHFLPAQAPLKDFIHHNTLHAFQNMKFFDALRSASEIFGYKVSLSVEEYRAFYVDKRISNDILERVLTERKGEGAVKEWKEKLINAHYEKAEPRIGTLRANWKKQHKIDLDSLVHPTLFRLLCSYLDQGISIWHFPVKERGFLTSLREIERNSFSSIFRKQHAKELFLKSPCEIKDLLKIIVGDESLFTQYLYDQQFAHQGWSGMVSVIEDQPQTLLDPRKISIHDLIVFELLLEIDALDYSLGKSWDPLGNNLASRPVNLFMEVPKTELHEVLELWQIAFEWTFDDQVLAGIKEEKPPARILHKSFQAMFCIDDRECSFRRYIEKFDPNSETFGTPGFFGVEFFYQPEEGKFYNKLCPAPVTPKYLIKEEGTTMVREQDASFSKYSHSFYSGWLISQTLGFWAALKLFVNIFSPSMSPATASSFRHMDKYSRLSIENKNVEDRENNLQVGFTIEEMANRVEGLLKSIGLIQDFANIIYIMGHGSSSVNNPHYAAYDCGACSGRAGSVNSRVMSFMANHPKVREMLSTRGLVVPAETQFVGGLHDTTRDEIVFFDEQSLTSKNFEKHTRNEVIFSQALDFNAKERSRRFKSVNTHSTAERIHVQVLKRSVSLFEPRPELNHATNALCVVGQRMLTKSVFLDRRAFMNSYDYKIDPEGNILFGIMKPIGPVCGGINLEYFFSRVDNQKLGAGTKLPHNVMGLFGVANGIDGDLRPGLPSQMIEVHDPVRLLCMVEHYPEIVLKTIQRAPEVYEWFVNEWVNIVAIHPETHAFYLFKNGEFTEYVPFRKNVEVIPDMTHVLEDNHENLPVYELA
jgi:uncharacterized protein YbcC (UPF0753/DUF2309 family)